MNYNGSASLNNFSNIRLHDFQNDNITVVETREASPIKMRTRIEYVLLIYRSTCSAQCKLLPMTSFELYSLSRRYSCLYFHFHRVFMLNVCCPIFTSYLHQMPLLCLTDKGSHRSVKSELCDTDNFLINSLKVNRRTRYVCVI